MANIVKIKSDKINPYEKKYHALSGILENMGVGLIVGNADGFLTMMNPEAQRILGVGLSEHSIEDCAKYFGFFGGDKKTLMKPEQVPMIQSLKGKFVCNQTVFCRNRSSGIERYLRFNSSFVRDHLGKVLMTTTTFTDVTNHVGKEAQLIHANHQLNKTMDDLHTFIGVVSHDLRSPLRAMSNLSQWVLSDPQNNLTDKSTKDLEDLQIRISLMQKMLFGLLDYYRIKETTPDHERVDCNELIDETMALMGMEEKKVKIIKESLPTIITSRHALSLVFRNLIDNAVKYSDVENIEITVSCYERKGVLHFSVRDNGPGVKLDDLEQVFGIFKTMERPQCEKSVGLGLALVRKTVQSFNGEIDVSNFNGDREANFEFSWVA